MKNKKMTAGFTLVELIVVIAILGILAGVGTVGYSGYIKKANMAADEQTMGNLRYAAIMGSIENPTVDGVVRVNNSGSTVDMGKTSAENAEIISDWMEAMFGSSWETSVKLKITGAEKALFIPVSQVTLSAEEQDWVNAINGSNYAGNYEAFAGTASNLSSAMSQAVASGDIEKLETLLGDAGYKTYLQNTWGIDYTDTEKKTEIGNATAFYIAEQTKGMSTDTAYTNLKNALASGNMNDLVKYLNAAGNGSAMAGTALGFGVASGYLNSDYISAESKAALEQKANQVTGITTMIAYLREVNGDAGFAEYMNSESSKADVDAYLSAMALVNSRQDEIDISEENVYSSNATLALLQGMLGG